MASPSRGAIGSRRVLHFVLTFDYIAIDGMGRAPMWVSSRNGVYFDTLLDAVENAAPAKVATATPVIKSFFISFLPEYRPVVDPVAFAKFCHLIQSPD